MKLLSLFSFILLLFSVQLSNAQVPAFECQELLPKEKAQQLLSGAEKRYKEISSLRAEFVQLSLFVGLSRKEASRGTVLFRKPGMMDWFYEHPEQQRFLSDGKTIWYYQPVFNQVMISDFNNAFSSELPVTFLLGMGSLSSAFSLQHSCRSGETIVAELNPLQADSTVTRFHLLLRARDLSPLGARVLDVGGNETTIVLINPQYNVNIPLHQFVMEIPRGADIIDQRKAPTHASVSETNLLDAGEVRQAQPHK